MTRLAPAPERAGKSISRAATATVAEIAGTTLLSGSVWCDLDNEVGVHRPRRRRPQAA